MPEDQQTSVTDAAAQGSPSGFLFGFSAYALWGFLPLYFIALQPANAFEIVAWRVIFSLVFCVIAMTVTRAWPAVVGIVRQPRLAGTLAIAAAFIFINWQVYVYASVNGRVIEAALGYFMNPIVTILLGVIFLREKLRPAQWVSVAVSAVAVIVLAVAYGSVPWISLVLAFTFGLYGFTKKRVSKQVDALSGLAIESAWLVPVAVVELIVVGSSAGLTFGTASALHTGGLVLAGVVTAVPLLLFAASTRRLPLVYVGLIQYLTPVLQFIVGAVFLHETLSSARWAGFALIWLALVILTIDVVVAAARARRASPISV